MGKRETELGKWGEHKAAAYLMRHGYEILETGFRCRRGEIDLIADKNSRLHFVEVKTRRTRSYGMPSESVDRNKRRHMKDAAAYYLWVKGREEEFVQFDVIEILVQGKSVFLRHLEDVL